MTTHLVVLSKEAYVELKNALPPASRFTNVEQWGFNHVWVYDPCGDVLIFTDQKIERLEVATVLGFEGNRGTDGRK